MTPIQGADGYYADILTGEIWSNRTGTFRKLSGGLCRGYRIYSLMIDGKQVMRSGHRMIATAAHGPCPEGMECSHINAIRSDNRAENLKWASSSENNGNDKRALGILRCGERHQNSKLKQCDVDEIRRLRANRSVTLKVLATRFGVAESTISFVALGKGWK